MDKREERRNSFRPLIPFPPPLPSLRLRPPRTSAGLRGLDAAEVPLMPLTRGSYASSLEMRFGVGEGVRVSCTGDRTFEAVTGASLLTRSGKLAERSRWGTGFRMLADGEVSTGLSMGVHNGVESR